MVRGNRMLINRKEPGRKKGWFEQKTKKELRKNSWYQIHEDGIWYGQYIRIERTILLRIYGNPRDKDDYK